MTGIVATLRAARSVAIVGASNDPSKPSGRVLRYLLKYGFGGVIYPINPQRASVQSLEAYPSLSSLPEVPDVIVIALPRDHVAGVVEEAGALGVPLAIIFSSGFAEVGGDGVTAQLELARVASAVGIRLVGPNCVGAVTVPNRLTGTFMTGLDQDRFDLFDSGLAFVSQSGAMGGFILNRAYSTGLGVGTFVSTGNEADVKLENLIEELAHDSSTSAILAYVEGVRDGAAFEDALSAAQQERVPLVVMKVGVSERGSQAAASHTGALSGSDTVFEGVLDRFGAFRARNIDQLLDYGRVLATPRRAEGNRVSIVTISGGAGALMTDTCEQVGLDVFEWDGAWQERMAAALPDFASTTNPIDTTGAIASDQDMLVEALGISLENPSSDLVIVLLGNLEAEESKICEGLLKASAASAKPLIVCWVGGSGTPERILSAAGVPTFGDPVRAVEAAAVLVRHSLAVPPVRVPRPEFRPRTDVGFGPPRAVGPSFLNEVDSKLVLRQMGIRTIDEFAVASEDEAAAGFAEVGGPVVLKLLTEQVAHKSDLGLVKVGLSSEDDVRAAAKEILAIGADHGVTDGGLLVQRYVSSPTELIIGMSRDRTFGPTVLVGMGGVTAEVEPDVQIRPAPISPGEANEMLSSLRGQALLRGARGRVAVDLDDLAHQVSAFSAAATGLPTWIESIDINPLLVEPSGRAIAVDGLVVLHEESHLALE